MKLSEIEFLGTKNKNTRKKQAAKKTTKSSPIAVTTRQNRPIFIYASQSLGKTRIYFSKSQNKLGFSKVEEIEIISENGGKESLIQCGDFHFSDFGIEQYLAYSRDFRNSKQTVVAKSSDMRHFRIVNRTANQLPKTLAVASNHKHRGNFLAYYGDNSIYACASRDLVEWHASGKLLSPRKDHFDSNGLSAIGAIATKRGILVLYEAKNQGRANQKMRVGAALFSSGQPYLLIWRSDTPIWQKTIPRSDYPIRPIGSVIFDNKLHIYWSSRKNEIFVSVINSDLIGLESPEAPIRLKRHPGNPIIEPNPKNAWEYNATFNPAALHLEKKIHLIYRAIGENGVSVFGYASTIDGFSIHERLNNPAFAVAKFPEKGKRKAIVIASQYVSGGSWIGCEDPRLTKIGNKIYMTYIAFDGCNPPGVALTSISVRDFLRKIWNWKPSVLISRPGEIQKNWMIFPEKIKGKYAILHSITPTILIEYVDDLDNKELVINSFKEPGRDEHRWDNIVRGAGAPPIKTKYGWLVFYHAMDKRDPNKYKVGAMLLDHDDPTKILHRSCQPLLEPSEKYENDGAKPGVVYVCGAVIKNGTLLVYYGGSDSVVCLATANLNEFLGDIVKEVVSSRSLLKKVHKLKHKRK